MLGNNQHARWYFLRRRRTHAQALGWLVMLMPTQQAARRDGDWDAWLRAWMALWGQVYHSAFWNTLWLHLVTRLAKHDIAGAPLTLSPKPTPCWNMLWLQPGCAPGQARHRRL